jgi:hypothetical protein
LPLTGAHAIIDCAGCHAVTSERTWSNVPWDCYACHARDFHRQDIHPIHDGAAPLSHVCSECHRTVTFKQAVVLPALVLARARASASGRDSAELVSSRHAADFALDHGKHRGLPCSSCHLAIDLSPRMIACTGCHAHDAATLPKLHRGKPVDTAAAGCLGCHPGGARR